MTESCLVREVREGGRLWKQLMKRLSAAVLGSESERPCSRFAQQTEGRDGRSRTLTSPIHSKSTRWLSSDGRVCLYVADWQEPVDHQLKFLFCCCTSWVAFTSHSFMCHQCVLVLQLLGRASSAASWEPRIMQQDIKQNAPWQWRCHRKTYLFRKLYTSDQFWHQKYSHQYFNSYDLICVSQDTGYYPASRRWFLGSAFGQRIRPSVWDYCRVLRQFVQNLDL